MDSVVGNDTRGRPCTSISPQAQAFIGESMGATWVSADFSPQGLTTLRKDNANAGAQGWETVKHHCPVNLHHEVHGGVPCQWVSPMAPPGPEVILYLHGGGFVVGSPEDDLSMTSRIANCLNRRVCVPRYRLAPEHPYPAARDDVRTVYSHLLHNHLTIFVIGESAGGNLALGLIQSHPSPPIAVALFSPWIDLSHSGDSHSTLRDLDPTLSIPHFLAPASLAYAGGIPVSDPQISPLFAEIPTNFPPTIISTATRDLLLSDSVRLARKLRGKDTWVDLRVAEGLWHVYEWYPVCPEAIDSLHQICSFLKKFFK